VRTGIAQDQAVLVGGMQYDDLRLELLPRDGLDTRDCLRSQDVGIAIYVGGVGKRLRQGLLLTRKDLGGGRIDYANHDEERCETDPDPNPTPAGSATPNWANVDEWTIQNAYPTSAWT